jgi:hypothetical protein
MIPEIFARLSRASGFSVYLSKSEKHVRHAHDQPACRIARLQHLIELCLQASAHLLLLDRLLLLGAPFMRAARISTRKCAPVAEVKKNRSERMAKEPRALTQLVVVLRLINHYASRFPKSVYQ